MIAYTASSEGLHGTQPHSHSVEQPLWMNYYCSRLREFERMCIGWSQSVIVRDQSERPLRRRIRSQVIYFSHNL